MRQWHVDPKLMCSQHLLGEHVEHHMIAGSIQVGMRLNGWINKGLIDVRTLYARHDAIEAELLARGMRMNSPLPEVSWSRYPIGVVNPIRSALDLSERCFRCRAKQAEYFLGTPGLRMSSKDK